MARRIRPCHNGPPCSNLQPLGIHRRSATFKLTLILSFGSIRRDIHEIELLNYYDVWHLEYYYNMISILMTMWGCGLLNGDGGRKSGSFYLKDTFQDAKSDRVKQFLKETEKYLQNLGSKLNDAKAMARNFENDMEESKCIGVIEENEAAIENEDDKDQAKFLLSFFLFVNHSATKIFVIIHLGGRMDHNPFLEGFSLVFCSTIRKVMRILYDGA